MLAYDDRGEGPAVLLLHSGGTSGRQWRKLAERLAPTRRVISPDFLGVGASSPQREGHAFYDDVAETVAILETLPAPADLVGHSYGGLVALTIARTRPELARRIAVYDPATYGLLHHDSEPAAAADFARVMSILFSDDPPIGTAGWIARFIDYWGGDGAWERTPPATKEALVRGGAAVAFQGRSITSDRTAASAYAGITAPTLFLTGEHGPPTVSRIADVLVGTLQNARKVVLEGAGHMGPITHADRVNDLVVAHLSG